MTSSEDKDERHFQDVFIKTNVCQDVYKNINEYNPGKKRKTLIVFDDVIADMINN